MNLRRLIGLSGVLSYLVIPVGLAAQVAGGVEFFGALDNSAPVTRTLGGLSLSVGTPYVGIRGSGGLGISSLSPQTSFQPESLKPCLGHRCGSAVGTSQRGAR